MKLDCIQYNTIPPFQDTGAYNLRFSLTNSHFKRINTIIIENQHFMLVISLR